MPSYTYEITCTCDEIEEWKKATGLMDSRGDPDGVTPKDLYNEINNLRQQQEKNWGPQMKLYVGNTRIE